MDTKHTPGPFCVGRNTDGSQTVFDGNGKAVATTCGRDDPEEELANARLLSDAPWLRARHSELLTALDDLLNQWRWPEWTASDADVQKAMAAIAKARGEQ